MAGCAAAGKRIVRCELHGIFENYVVPRLCPPFAATGRLCSNMIHVIVGNEYVHPGEVITDAASESGRTTLRLHEGRFALLPCDAGNSETPLP